jgi:hypothetical protein
MADKFDSLNPRNTLPPRPRETVQAEQRRHDRALVRGLAAFFVALVVGGGLAAFIVFGPLARGMATLQAVLVSIVFVLPLAAALVMMSRVPPAPFESFTDPERELDRKERARRAVLLSSVFNAGLLALQWFWLWPRLGRYHSHWAVVVANAVPTFFIVGLGLAALYARPRWFNPDLSLLDDEVTQSFRARAQSLGYLLLLAIVAVLTILAETNPPLAAHYLSLGIAMGVILPVLYFVYLDWRASG